MIHFFATRRHGKVIRKFFDSWGKEMKDRIRIWSYEWLPLRHPIPPGVCIFTDLERLLPDERTFATTIADHFAAHPGSYRVLNHPGRWLDRFTLQRQLSKNGVNDFQVWRLNETADQVRYPVFVRRDHDHKYSSNLFQSADELQQHVARLSLRDRLQKERLMVVEYVHVANGDGVFRKYSAMRIGDALVPRHVLFSRKWVTKNPNLVDHNTLAEESDFQQSFPHANALLEIFRLAGIEYGRVDYGIKDGRLQIWEINTNPVIVPIETKLNPARLEGQRCSAKRILDAFQQLADDAPRADCAIPFAGMEGGRWQRARLFEKFYGLIRK